MSIFNRFTWWLGKFNDGVEWIAVNMSWIMLFGIVVLNIVQVYYRYVLNNALSWTEEASLWMLVWITFLILPVAYRQGLNISMMYFRNLLKGNRFEYVLRCVFHLIVLLIAVVCLDQAWSMYQGGHRLQQPALEISKAWVYIIMPPAWVMLMLTVTEKFTDDVRGIFDPEKAHELLVQKAKAKSGKAKESGEEAP